MGGWTKRRWFRFSLRTLFVGVTVVACWLGYQLHWMHQRQAFIRQRLAPVGEAKFPRMISTGRDLVDAPGPLRLFGERGYGHVDVRVFQGGLSDTPNAHAELKMARRLFPEAEVSCEVVMDD